MKKTLLILAALLAIHGSYGQTANRYDIIGYYSGDGKSLSAYPIEKLTQLIFSFLHLKGNELAFDNEQRKQDLLEIVALKNKRNPSMKVLISLGGWGGCATCSPVFATAENRQAFANSVLQILQTTQTDGIDLDWEYPTIPGPPGHPYSADDKANFTDLIQRLRTTMGDKYELSFAAGGFDTFIAQSVDWAAVTPLVNRINLMTYDLINGYSKVTGHHTALYSRPSQKESTDNCVQQLLKLGVPANKLVIGAAFYSRVWANVAATNNGLDQCGQHTAGVSYKHFQEKLTPAQGFTAYWDDTAKATHFYNAEKQLFATTDDPQSIKAKVAYMKKYGLGGIMFWELREDAPVNGLLSVMEAAVKE